MPCDQVRTHVVNLQKADLDRLAESLRVAGYTVTRINAATIEGRGIRANKGSVEIVYSVGRLNVKSFSYGDPVAIANDVKAGYAAECVKFAMEQTGWSVEFAPPTPNAVRSLAATKTTFSF